MGRQGCRVEENRKPRTGNTSIPWSPWFLWFYGSSMWERTGFTSPGKALCFGCLFTQDFLFHCGNIYTVDSIEMGICGEFGHFILTRVWISQTHYWILWDVLPLQLWWTLSRTRVPTEVPSYPSEPNKAQKYYFCGAPSPLDLEEAAVCAGWGQAGWERCHAERVRLGSTR